MRDVLWLAVRLGCIGIIVAELAWTARMFYRIQFALAGSAEDQIANFTLWFVSQGILAPLTIASVYILHTQET